MLLSRSDVLRVRSLLRFAENAKTEVELANLLDVSPRKASAALSTLKGLLATVPQRKRAKTQNEHHKQPAAV